MAIAPGTRLDVYEIIGSLGAGGMGEVYRARDYRLRREVAIKVLPEEFAANPNRCKYFEQEARSVAALNHPNIVALYDIGSEGPVRFMVSELVAGETLEALIRRGPVPVRQLPDISAQVADGLTAAHAAGITHRDLKPANIMITPEGRVKILDFGLARQRRVDAVATDTTATLSQTKPGVIMGTVPYMSPEQIRAGALDYRSDQFSFGLILYEMAAGRRAFKKPQPVQTMSPILTDDAAPLPASVPAPLRWIIERCLAKQPAERYDSTRDLFYELRSLRLHFADLTAVPAGPTEVSRRRRLAIPVAIGLAALLLVAEVLWWRTHASRPGLESYSMRPFAVEPTAYGVGPLYWNSWAPDSKAVAYTAVPAGWLDAAHPQVLIRYLDAPAPMQITHLAGGAFVVGWTPDAQRLLIFTCDTTPCRLMTIATVGGEPEPFMSFEGEVECFTAAPDFKTFAVFMKAKDGHYGVFLSSPPGSKLKEYAPEPFSTRSIFEVPSMHFSPDGKRILLTYVGEKYESQTWLLPFPPSDSHPPEQVLRDIPVRSGLVGFGWMPNSRHIICSFITNSERIPRLWSADTISGEIHALTSGQGASLDPSVSPDGRKIVFTQWSDNMDVVRVELDSGKTARLISTPRVEAQPAYAVSRPLLAYTTNRSGLMEIWIRDGDNPDRPLLAHPPAVGEVQNPIPSPDGGRVMFQLWNEVGGHLWIASVSGGAPVLLTPSSAAIQSSGAWSPDSNWFAYVAEENGHEDLVKVRTTGAGSPVVLKKNVRPFIPVWSRSGDWIAYSDAYADIGGVWRLISQDGATTRDLGKLVAESVVFSADGKRLYGLRQNESGELLFSRDIASGQERIMADLGEDFRPMAPCSPCIHLSLAPDGNSFVYSVGWRDPGLWMMERVRGMGPVQ